jgi:hypothetical protein
LPLGSQRGEFLKGYYSGIKGLGERGKSANLVRKGLDKFGDNSLDGRRGGQVGGGSSGGDIQIPIVSDERVFSSGTESNLGQMLKSWQVKFF